MYRSPGNADQLTPALLAAWNATIQQAYASPDIASLTKTRFFTLDHGSIQAVPSDIVHWFADPAEPAFCLGMEIAQKLSDWGVMGRHQTHNEYCEYVQIYRLDGQGRRRLKRVEITTELREYWCVLAMKDPELMRTIASGILKQAVSFTDLYGVADPLTLTERNRLISFSTQVAGHGYDGSLAEVGVPKQPIGALNRERALFMTHPINGLDDLLYIVLFGAQAYFHQTPAGKQEVTREQLFIDKGVDHLACRHADPAAAMGAYGAAWNGRTVAFADPLGMYITSFTPQAFLWQGNPIPASWSQFSRGTAGLWQRLEFGPADDDPAFLDEATTEFGGVDVPITGGFQIVEKVEVGPRLLIGPASELKDADYREILTPDTSIKCSEAGVCRGLSALWQAYQQEHGGELIRVGPRLMGPRP